MAELRQSKAKWVWLFGAIFLLLLGIGVLALCQRPQPPALKSEQDQEPYSFARLLASSQEVVIHYDIARLNLLCTEGLPGSDGKKVEVQLSQLDAWAARIKSETTRHWYRYQQNPAEFNRSEGFFRMLMMSVVPAEDFRIQYDPVRQTNFTASTAHDGFFASPDLVFLTGLLGEGRKGTCSSLPVLYVALGRRLGYPLHLVTTKGHLFVRWEGQGERFNIEATSHGLNTFNDDYYRQWPFPVTAEEEKAEGYLRNLDPTGELALFLSIRGMCLRDNGRLGEAAEAFSAASRLAPHCRSYAEMSRFLASGVRDQKSENSFQKLKR